MIEFSGTRRHVRMIWTLLRDASNADVELYAANRSDAQHKMQAFIGFTLLSSLRALMDRHSKRNENFLVLIIVENGLNQVNKVNENEWIFYGLTVPLQPRHFRIR